MTEPNREKSGSRQRNGIMAQAVEEGKGTSGVATGYGRGKIKGGRGK